MKKLLAVIILFALVISLTTPIAYSEDSDVISIVDDGTNNGNDEIPIEFEEEAAIVEENAIVEESA